MLAVEPSFLSSKPPVRRATGDVNRQSDEEMTLTGSETASEAVLETEPIARLREMGRALGRDVPRRILELYLGDSPTRLATLRRGIAAGDAQAIERAAHALKGSSANLGASGLAEHCHQLEKLSADAVPADAEARLAALEAEYGRVELAMRELLTEFS